MGKILAIDQSTSATKALLFSTDGEEIYQNTLAAAHSLLERTGLTGRELSCLSITNQRETIWVIDGRPIYAFEGLINYSGATIAWLRDQLELIESAAESEQLATSVEDNDGVYFVPAFVGLNAPYWRADIKAAIVGLLPSSTKAHVVRAALALMADEAGTDLGSIRADGGALRNRFLMQLIADLTGITVYAAELPELSALGAVFAGMLGWASAIWLSWKALVCMPQARLK